MKEILENEKEWRRYLVNKVDKIDENQNILINKVTKIETKAKVMGFAFGNIGAMVFSYIAKKLGL